MTVHWQQRWIGGDSKGEGTRYYGCPECGSTCVSYMTGQSADDPARHVRVMSCGDADCGFSEGGLTT